MTTSHLDDTPHVVEVQTPSRRMLAALERHWRFSWGAVFAGAIVSIGIWLLLYVLGLGIGLTAINPAEVGSLRGAGLTTGIWSLIVPIVAMFLGGIAAA